MDPSSIVLSESMAKKYFGEVDAVNNTLFLNDSIALNVTGIFKDLPQNTHLSFDAVITTERIKQEFNNIHRATIYFHFKSNSNRAELNDKVNASAKKFLPRPSPV